jgi:hypothetical protein
LHIYSRFQCNYLTISVEVSVYFTLKPRFIEYIHHEYSLHTGHPAANRNSRPSLSVEGKNCINLLWLYGFIKLKMLEPFEAQFE